MNNKEIDIFKKLTEEEEIKELETKIINLINFMQEYKLLILKALIHNKIQYIIIKIKEVFKK